MTQSNTSPKSPITTHVLDIARGKPARGVPVQLEFHENGQWKQLGKGTTNMDGRCPDLLPAGAKVGKGTYRITFDLQGYYVGQKTFYPFASIVFEIDDTAQHYHVPLLVSGYGYSTYRGS